MKKDHPYLPIFAGIFISLIFGFSFIMTKEALAVIQPFHLLALRFLLASILLWTLRMLGLIRISYAGKKLLPLFILACFQPIAYFVTETLGIQRTSASETGMMIALIPVVVALLGVIFLRERPTLKQWLFILMSVTGVIFIAIMRGTEGGGNLGGMVLLFGAVLSAGVFNILSRKNAVHFTAMEITFFMMNAGGLIFNAISIGQHSINREMSAYFIPLLKIDTLLAIAYLGIFSSVVAFFLLNYMLSKMQGSRVAIFGNLVTVVSIAAGVLLLGESFYWFHGIGALLILAGVWGTNYFGIKAKLEKSKLRG